MWLLVFLALLVSTLIVIGRKGRLGHLPRWSAVICGVAYVVFGYATLDLGTSPRAGAAIFMIPVVAIPVALIGYLIGLLVRLSMAFFMRAGKDRVEAAPGASPEQGNGNTTWIALRWVGLGCFVAVALSIGYFFWMVGSTCPPWCTPLMDAAYRGDTDEIEELVAAGASVSEHGGPEQMTPLMMSARRNRLAAATLLIDLGADVDQVSAGPVDSGEATALMQAANKGHTEMVRLLLERGAKVDTPSPRTGFTALMRAAKSGHYETAKVLIEHGANVNATIVGGSYGVLTYASIGKHENVVQLLLDNGARTSAIYLGPEWKRGRQSM